MITPKRQQQCIADLINGFEPELQRCELDKTYQTLWDEVQLYRKHKYDRYDIQQGLLRFKLGQEEDVNRIIDTILALEPGYRHRYETLAEVGPTLPETRWLWTNWIPRGLLTLLAAWPGVGKTYFALDLAHRVISGLDTPDGSAFDRGTGNVIYVDAEDFLPTIYARTKAWGMDGHKFYPVRRPPRDLLDMGKREYQDQLIDMCYDLQPDLVVVDSLSSVNARGENNIEDMRDILFFFTEIPEAFDCGLVLIHHPRKPGKGITRPITMHDLRGTGHITAMARIIIGLDVLRDSPEENPNGPRQVKALKNNLTRYPKPLVAQFTPLPDNPDFIHITYSDMPLSVVSPETQTEQCARWLLELLQEEGPLSFGKIEAYATEENFKSGVVRAARRLLGDKIVDTKGLKERGNQWALADEEIDSDEILLSQKETLTDQCAEWLLEALQNGPLSYAKLKSLATRAGFSENVLQKGRHCLGSQIVDTMGPRVKGNRWALADYIT